MANEYLQRTPTSTGNRKVFTWSGWVKSNIDNSPANGNAVFMCAAENDGNTYYRTRLGRYVVNEGDFGFNHYDGANDNYGTQALNRDHSNWEHYICAVDTTQEQTTDRVKLYLNGVYQSDLTTVVAIDKDLDTFMNGNSIHFVGADSWTATPNSYSKLLMSDVFFIDGQALTPDVFGFYKEGDGYVSAGSTQATDFRPGQWVPKRPRIIKTEIERRGGFGVNGFYLPMNDSSNPGADFHCTPNSIITLKGEDLPQPRNGAPTTSDAYVSQLRSDANAANLVLAVAGASTVIGADIVNNGYEWTGASGTTAPTGWSAEGGVATYAVNSSGQLVYDRNGDSGTPARFSQDLETVDGNTYYLTLDLVATTVGGLVLDVGGTTNVFSSTTATGIKRYRFTATSSTTTIAMRNSSATGTLTIDNVKVRQVDAVPRDYSADIKGSGSNKTLTSNGQPGVGLELGGYYGSAMTFDGTGDSLQGPLNSSDLEMGSDDFTVEAWVNPSDVSGPGGIAGIWDGSSNDRSWLLYHGSGGGLNFIISADGSGNDVVASGISMTTGQWYHVVGEKEGTTIRIIVNGVVAAIDTAAAASVYNASEEFRIGIYDFSDSTPQHFAGHIQDVRVYKGVAKYKGGFDVPKPYTPVGIESWRQVPDNCKNNFATWNPLLGPQGCALADGNLTVTSDGANQHKGTRSTMGMSSGKWYWEYRVGSVVTNSYVGVSERMPPDGLAGSNYILHGTGGNNFVNPNGSFSVTDASITTGMIIGCAFDRDASTQQLKVYKNGSLAVTATSSDLGDGVIYLAHNSFNAAVSDGWEGNFGQNPTFSGTVTAGTYTDSNGKGLFKHQPPAGYLALCEDNLPTPAIADPGDYFKTVLYRGTGSSRAVTGVGFKPDFIWCKSRTNTEGHIIFDSVRGPEQRLLAMGTQAEATSAGGVMSFDDDGYSTAQYAGTNQSGQNYVAWCWKAGGAAVSNTDGTITSQVSANQTAGFSIVSYTANGTDNATVGHGLGKVPDLIIVKNRDGAVSWGVWHSSLTSGQVLRLNEDTEAQSPATAYFQDENNTSSVFALGTNDETNDDDGDTYIAYCWAEIEGYSKFGRWYGNGDPDGPFVYCGFKPAFIMSKRTDSATNGNWTVFDSSRDSTNPVGAHFRADATNEELFFGSGIDIVSNGFKIREAASALNNGSGTYIFMAFAESPFKTANAK